jgi:hypothetical protein
MYCTAQHDSYISAFYSTKADLLTEWNAQVPMPVVSPGSPSLAAPVTPFADATDVAQQEKEARSKYGWNHYSGITMVCIAVMFDVMPARVSFASRMPIAIIAVCLQALFVALFFKMLRLPLGSKHRTGWWFRGIIVILLFASAVMLIYSPLAKLPDITNAAMNIEDIKKDIGKLNNRLLRIEGQEIDQKKNDLKQQIDKLLTRDEASHTYVNRQDLDMFVKKTDVKEHAKKP